MTALETRYHTLEACHPKMMIYRGALIKPTSSSHTAHRCFTFRCVFMSFMCVYGLMSVT